MRGETEYREAALECIWLWPSGSKVTIEMPHGIDQGEHKRLAEMFALLINTIEPRIKATVTEVSP